MNFCNAKSRSLWKSDTSETFNRNLTQMFCHFFIRKLILFQPRANLAILANCVRECIHQLLTSPWSLILLCAVGGQSSLHDVFAFPLLTSWYRAESQLCLFSLFSPGILSLLFFAGVFWMRHLKITASPVLQWHQLLVSSHWSVTSETLNTSSEVNA